MSQVKHISFEELAANLAAILDTVRAEHTSVVVEYASGENVVIKRSTPSRRRASTARAKSNTQPSQSNQSLNTQNISSVGAVYDLDPGSITPG